MKKTSVSKLLHGIIILTFFLPFFYTGCNPSEKEKNAWKQAKQDSVTQVTQALRDSVARQTDSLRLQSGSVEKVKDTGASTQTAITIDSTITTVDTNSEKEEVLSDELISKYPVLTILLRPSANTYTGIGTLLNGSIFLMYIAFSMTFLLLLIGLLLKFVDRKALITFCILDVLMLTGLLISRSPTWSSDRLWGFWVCLGLMCILCVYDTYVLVKSKNKN